MPDPRRPRDGFFLGAESCFNVATEQLSGSDGIRPIANMETDRYQITKDFLGSRDRYFKYLFAEPDVE